MMKFSILFFSLLVSLVTIAQKEADYWYFGRNAGIRFTTSGPVVLETSAVCALVAIIPLLTLVALAPGPAR